jgi:hypothetical protein
MTKDLPEGFGATPFLRFYHGEWQDMLEAIEVPDMPECSWDRKAAYMFWAGEGRKDLFMSRLQIKAKVLEGEREERLAGIWAEKVKERFGLIATVHKAEFMTELSIAFPGKGWDSGKTFHLFVIVLAPDRKPNKYEAERMALDTSVAAFDNVDALLEALSGVITS